MAWAATARQQDWAGRTPRERQAPLVPEAITRFLRKAHELGVDPKPLVLKERSSARQPVLRVSWRQPWELRLGSRRLLSLELTRGSTFEQHAPERLIMTVEAERLLTLLKPLPEVEKVVVLVEQRVDPILAVRVAGQWFETLRWYRRPYILSDDEVESMKSSATAGYTPSLV